MNDLPNQVPAVSVRNLSHMFGNRPALTSVSFEVQARSLHGFVGPNGAGKTTALKLICTLLRPQVGQVKVFGLDVERELKETRRRIGFMPDHFSMYRQMTVFEYLDFFAAAYGLSGPKRNSVIGDVLALTDMQGRRDTLINGLSRGMQQRVSLARVLVNDPKLLLLDEPASGLDPRARIELMEILRELRRMGKTVFISSHILSELAELCDSVTIIDRGHIKYSGAMNDLLTHGQANPIYRLVLDETDPPEPAASSAVAGSPLPGISASSGAPGVSPLPSFTAAGVSPTPNITESLSGLPGVVRVDKLDEKPEYRVELDQALTDKSNFLRGVLDLGLSIAAFNPDRKHLNQAFMDLTEQGVA